jgi:hypothetical protein
MSEHIIKYERSTRTSLWCAQCSCGWQTVLPREHMLRDVALHLRGIEIWIEADPHAPEFAEKVA